MSTNQGLNPAVKLSKIEDHKSLQYKQYTIFYHNEEAALNTFHEVFNQQYYHFNSDTISPLIIDGGANIGIATIFFKERYPQARIICFEPDPNAFCLLKKNIQFNNLKHITLINAALAKEEGIIDFYGQIHGDAPDARGNSIIETWGLQRTISHTIQVNAVKLSHFIQEPVDLLKLDIEGAEQQVLEEIQDKLPFIHQIALEIHGSNRIKPINSLERIVSILTQHHFTYELIHKNTLDLLPEPVKDWAKRIQPHLYELKAIRGENG